MVIYERQKVKKHKSAADKICFYALKQYICVQVIYPNRQGHGDNTAVLL